MRGICLNVQARIFIDNTTRSSVNHHEWYISKILKNFRAANTLGLKILSYRSNGKPCCTKVPKIEVTARARNRNMVSLTEENNLYSFVCIYIIPKKESKVPQI